ncbi:hypothetical protein [Salinactinospora qingdaonensis]|uniref:Integral membrane protein n=1 Tax=Salinactinospora qingdaonensis TaxID=702744 RepID=A0ABP7F2J1_9ACTN
MADERAIELRIHGVSGATAEELLAVSPAVRRAGDQLAGFFRPRTESDTHTVPGVDQEAFAWGNLTSGSASRALWLLLLPFMLVNMAYWMRPRRSDQHDPPAHRAADACYDGLVRLLGLSLTALLTLAAAGVGMDLMAWQCAGYGQECAQLRPWLGFLSAPGAPLAEPGRALAAGALLPLLVIAVLWSLSRRTGAAYAVSLPPPAEEGPTAPLSSPEFWRNGETVGRLRSAHIAIAATTVAGLLIAAPLLHDQTAGTVTELTTAGSALAAALALVGLGSAAGVLIPGTGGTWNQRATLWCALARDGALLLLLLAAGYALWPRPEWQASGALPFYTDALNILFVTQCVLSVLLLVTALVQYRSAPPHATTAMRGMSGPATVVFGVLLGGVFSAALVYQTAGWLGGCYYPGASEAGCITLRPPSSYAWLQLTFTLEAALALLCGLWLAVLALWRRRRAAQAIGRRYGRSRTASRTREIAWARALASLPEVVPACLTALLLPPVTLVGLVGYAALTGRLAAGAPHQAGSQTSPAAIATNDAWLQDGVTALVAVGSWLGGLFLVALVWVGRSAYRDLPTRQAVGVLWDIGTFWPRAAHPLAPPCYAERAVPQLATRVAALTGAGTGVILSGHSQGSVLAAATVWQLPWRCRERVVLLTHGSPLDRLYARYFPAYFGQSALTELHQRVTGWRNLWRVTDPIGGPIRLGDTTVKFATPLPDPRHYGHLSGEALYPPVLRHSDYTADPAYADALSWAATTLTTTQPPSSVG